MAGDLDLCRNAPPLGSPGPGPAGDSSAPPARALAAGLRELVGVADADLREARESTLRVPPRHAGMRALLTLAVLFAALTLSNLRAQPLFSGGAQAKVPGWKVAATVTATRAVIRSRFGVTILFRLAARGLPLPAEEKNSGKPAVQPALSSDPGRVHTL